MNHPRIASVQTADDHTLIVTFDNKRKKKYDVSRLFEREMFAPLKNTALFKAARVEQGGYAVSWGDSIDISEHELWVHGESVS